MSDLVATTQVPSPPTQLGESINLIQIGGLATAILAIIGLVMMIRGWLKGSVDILEKKVDTHRSLQEQANVTFTKAIDKLEDDREGHAIRLTMLENNYRHIKETTDEIKAMVSRIVDSLTRHK